MHCIKWFCLRFVSEVHCFRVYSFIMWLSASSVAQGNTHTLKMYNEVPRTFVPFCTFHLLFYMHLCLKPSDGHGGLRVCIPVQPSDGPGLASQCGQTRVPGAYLPKGLPSSQCLDPVDLSTGNSGGPWASVWPFFSILKNCRAEMS